MARQSVILFQRAHGTTAGQKKGTMCDRPAGLRKRDETGKEGVEMARPTGRNRVANELKHFVGRLAGLLGTTWYKNSAHGGYLGRK
jgi:hypothetical protein